MLKLYCTVCTVHTSVGRGERREWIPCNYLSSCLDRLHFAQLCGTDSCPRPPAYPTRGWPTRSEIRTYWRRSPATPAWILREPSNTSLDTQGAQQHQPGYPGSPATPAWIGWGRSTRTTTPYSTRFRNAPKICSQFIETIQDEKAKVVAAVWGTESIQFLAALCTYSCSAPG